ncbi:MAG: NAD(P)-dependent glycerol-3-phosphate dehydrogenase [Candidatus Cloacimonetes bacterium]|jgi:glycerol-3-phosphate dehydrogenase (NAD(P)+)|nr:NAD(P)-dependent glycerol-3-phosphate dehydrogenase [Candidatus Cloacimonadota bacterium]
MPERIAVVGAGSWGTALADLLARKGEDVVLWSFEPEVAEAIEARHENPKYLQGVALAPSLRATPSLADAVRGATVVVSVSPAQHVRGIMAQAAEYLQPDAIVVSASKGIEQERLNTMAQVLAQVLPRGTPTAYLSGPSFALEVAQQMPTAVTIASHDEGVALRAQELFQTPYFRPYTSQDVIGVELGGALKNVIAVAAGMVAGLGFGHNTLAALITRGLAEITRLAVELGANPLTLSGLAGMGDLILTCTGGLSRNRHVGMEIGKGRTLDEVLSEMTMVAEGVATTRATYALAQRTRVEMPIASAVHEVLFENRPPAEAVESLMLRDPKPELWR